MWKPSSLVEYFFFIEQPSLVSSGWVDNSLSLLGEESLLADQLFEWLGSKQVNVLLNFAIIVKTGTLAYP